MHHEAKLQGKPMTRILNDIVTRALANTEGMRIAEAELRQEARDPAAA